jgi:hypothetical protein
MYVLITIKSICVLLNNYFLDKYYSSIKQLNSQSKGVAMRFHNDIDI